MLRVYSHPPNFVSSPPQLVPLSLPTLPPYLPISSSLCLDHFHFLWHIPSLLLLRAPCPPSLLFPAPLVPCAFLTSSTVPRPLIFLTCAPCSNLTHPDTSCLLLTLISNSYEYLLSGILYSSFPSFYPSSYFLIHSIELMLKTLKLMSVFTTSL